MFFDYLKMICATKIRIYPTASQANYLCGLFGAVRFCYNKALHIKRHFYEVRNVNLSPVRDIKPLLSKAKKSRKYDWLKNYDAIALQQSIRHLDKAFVDFFEKRRGFPKFKSRYGTQSSYHCTHVSCGENWIKIPKLSKIKAKVHRPITGKVKSITLSLEPTGKYYASVLFDNGLSETPQLTAFNSDLVIGLDMGLKTFLTDSTGQIVENPRYFQRALSNLKRKQKKLSRKVAGSTNRAKARLLVAKVHNRAYCQRMDFLHRVSRRMADENQAVVVESLSIKAMLKNHRLAQSISDVSWSQFFDLLAYKLKRQGKRLIKIDRFYPSSRICSSCGHKLDKLSLSTRVWTCSVCGVVHDRDCNAAINIRKQGLMKLKAEALSVSACGGYVRHCESSALAAEARSHRL